jgi:hypothetical protein
MTYHDNDPKRPVNDPARDPLMRPDQSMPRRSAIHKSGDHTMSWIVGAVAMLALVGVVFWFLADRPDTVATPGQPAVTQQDTTGTAPTVPATRTPDPNSGTTPTPPAQR